MVILEDTRNHIGKHRNIHAYLDTVGVAWDRSKLYVGDYMLADSGAFAIDTKSGVLELMQDMFQQHDRFRRECERAQQAGIRLLILIEEELPEGGLAAWQSPRRRGKPLTKANPATLRKAMLTMQERYGVRFRFCRPEETGELVLRYLVSERDRGRTT